MNGQTDTVSIDTILAVADRRESMTASFQTICCLLRNAGLEIKAFRSSDGDLDITGRASNGWQLSVKIGMLCTNKYGPARLALTVIVQAPDESEVSWTETCVELLDVSSPEYTEGPDVPRLRTIAATAKAFDPKSSYILAVRLIELMEEQT